jgi:HD-GYP domain-containing protein (c-di-GMP phosphodiesterase class II)
MKKGAEELSVECRVLTIADIYDALTCTDRPYKKPMPRAKAFSILEAMVEEGKLDGQLVKWFEEAIEYYYKETEDEKNK